MSIKRRGTNTFLVRVYLGRDPITKKRVEINETVHGSLAYARKVETKLKEQKYSNRLRKTPQMTIDALTELYLDSVRHTMGPVSFHGYKDNYKRYILPYLGSMQINKIKPGDVQKFFNFMLDKKESVDE